MTTSNTEQVGAMLEERGVEQTEEDPFKKTESDTEQAAAAVAEESANGSAAEQQAASPVVSERKGGMGLGREMTISTLVHLLGVSTAAEVDVLENKVDTLTNELRTVNSRLEKIASQIQSLSGETMLERIDLQLSDIRNLMKKALPGAVGRYGAADDAGDREKAKPRILTSAPSSTSAESGVEQAGQESQSEAEKKASKADLKKDADFQASEGQRMREPSIDE